MKSIRQLLITIILFFTCLEIYTKLLMDYKESVFTPIFNLAGGDGMMVFFIIGGIVFGIIVAIWFWNLKIPPV